MPVCVLSCAQCSFILVKFKGENRKKGTCSTVLYVRACRGTRVETSRTAHVDPCVASPVHHRARGRLELD